MVEALGGTQTRWAHADDENVDVAVGMLSVCSSGGSGWRRRRGHGGRTYVSAIVKAG